MENVSGNDDASELRRRQPFWELLQEAEINNDKEAMYWCAFRLYFGTAVRKDEKAAFEWWNKAAALGSGKSLYEVGYCWKHGKGTVENQEIAQQWLAKAMAGPLHKEAEEGDTQAIVTLAEAYQDGRGIQQNHELAMKWYHKAAELGNTRAMCLIGRTYGLGLGPVKADWKEGIKWYRMAAERGDCGAESQLGSCYLDGLGVPVDYEKAVEWYKRSAQQQNDGALVSLGFCYLYGKGVEKDEKKAVEYYRQAVAQGSAVALINLGYCLQWGLGTERDLHEAVVLFQQAFDSGDDEDAVGHLNSALRELRANAHERRDGKYMQTLAYCYEKGMGDGRVLQPNTELATAWQREADLVQQQHCQTTTNGSSLGPLQRQRSAEGMCVCCEERPPVATLVHGDSGHSCCCLSCACACHAKNLGCPLCRLTIDKVVLRPQQLLLLSQQPPEPLDDGTKNGNSSALTGPSRPLASPSCARCGKNLASANIIYVHGETGHMSKTSAECLSCACLSGQCPVCSMPTDKVILNFGL